MVAWGGEERPKELFQVIEMFSNLTGGSVVTWIYTLPRFIAPYS